MTPTPTDLTTARAIFAQCEEAANCHRDNAGAAAECVVSVIATALRAQRTEYAALAINVYGDAVGAIAGDEPSVVGCKISAAILKTALRAADTGSRGEGA